MNKVVEYLKSENYVDINELRKVLMLDNKALHKVIIDFNQRSFYYKIVIEDNIIYLENKNQFPNKRHDRLRILRDVWLSGLYQMDDLEIIFGRSKKTLYKDIKWIKADITNRYVKRNCTPIIFYHQLINEFNYAVMLKIGSENISKKELYTNIANNIYQVVGGSKITKQVVNERLSDNTDFSSYAKMLTIDLINNIERYLKKKIIRNRIYEQLLVHIESSYWRYKYMVFINMIDIQQVINSNLYEYYQISMIVEMILRSHNLYSSKEEIMYITLYFLNPDIYLSINVKIDVKRGSQYALVQKELNKYFQDFNIVEEDADVVIGLVKINVENMIQVKIPFDVYDIRILSRYLRFKRNNTSSYNLYLQLKPLLKQTITFNQFAAKLEAPIYSEHLRLNCFLNSEYISIEEKALSWDVAIRKAAKILEDKMYITKTYADSIIQLVRKYNAEIMIADGIILAHAPITNDVLQSGISFLLCKKPIVFTGNKQVYLIILFCANTEVDLLLALQELNSVLGNQVTLRKIMNIKTKEQLIELLTVVAKIK